MKLHSSWIALAALVAMSCHSTPPPSSSAGGVSMPATYRGDLPCADCPGIRHHLDLWPDGAFHLRREWLDRDIVRFELGRWRLDEARHALVLQGPGEAPIELEIKSPDRLRMLDREGRPIESSLPYELARAEKFEPVTVTGPLRGELEMAGETLRFVECLTGRTYDVLRGRDYTPARKALRGVNRDRVFVTMEGKIKKDGVVLDRFMNAWPEENCEQSRADASLINTYWRIDRLGGEKVTAVEGRREPHLILRAGEDATYNATVGCEQLAGRFKIHGDAINFKPTSSLSKDCTPELQTLELNLFAVLINTRRWLIIGNTLELRTETGDTAALFNAVYF